MQKRLWEMLGADRAGAGFLLRAALITALVAAVTGSRYFTGTEDWAFWQYAYFFVFLTGHVFVLTLLFLVVPGWPLTEFPAGSPGLEPREECGLSKFFNLGPNAAKPCT